MLLAFIVLGMFFGTDGLLKIKLDNYSLVADICSAALIFIMFYGGFGTNISKANALNYSMVFWDSIFNELKIEYPDVETDMLLVDAASMFMVTKPEKFGIVVTSNLFGDILTDLGAAITGGLGIAAGANINPERKYPPMFEPIHGSAPDIANQGIANPLASIWAVSQMLDYFGYSKLGKLILDAIREVIKEGKIRTKDLGGINSTSEMGNEVRHIISAKLEGAK